MNAVSTPALAQHRGWFTPDWANWRLALVVALIVIPAAVLALPLEVGTFEGGKGYNNGMIVVDWQATINVPAH